MTSLNIVFMGTPDFAVPCLDRLLQEKIQVAAVVTQPDRPKGRGQKLAASPVKEFAVARGLPVLQPEKIKEAGFIDRLRALEPDAIVVVAFGQFLPREMLQLPRLGCINVHASLLPRYRGAAPIHWAVINGETTTGVTTMLMDTGMDTGDMLMKKETAIASGETTGELHDRLKFLGAEVLIETLKLWTAGKITRQKQPDAEATYAPLLRRDTERIDWQQSSQAIHNLIRGLNPWPGAFCLHRGKILKIWRAETAEGPAAGAQSGGVTAVDDDGIVIAAGTGYVRLLEVQPESKRRMACLEFARGYGLNVGEVLG